MTSAPLSTDSQPPRKPATAPLSKLTRWLAPFQLELLADALALIDTLGQGEGEVTLVIKAGRVRFIRPAPSIDCAPRTPEELAQTAPPSAGGRRPT